MPIVREDEVTMKSEVKNLKKKNFIEIDDEEQNDGNEGVE